MNKELSKKFEDTLIAQGADWTVTLEQLDAKLKIIDEELNSAEMQTDRSENASYQLLRDSKDTNNNLRNVVLQKVVALENYIAAAKEYKPQKHITVGTTVEVVAGKENKTFVFKLVPTELCSAKKGLVSVESRVGTKLLGMRVGESMQVETVKGPIEYKVKDFY